MAQTFASARIFLKQDNTLMIACPQEVDIATLAKAKRLSRLDHYGVSGRALYLFIRNLVAAAINTFVSQAVCSSEIMSRLKVKGFIQAKEARVVSAKECRAILRMPWSLRLAHGQVNHNIAPALAAKGIKSPEVYSAGGTRGTSVTDIAFACQLMAEKGLDTKSRFAIAASDVAVFFDNNPLGKLVGGMSGIEPALIAAAARLHV